MKIMRFLIDIGVAFCLIVLIYAFIKDFKNGKTGKKPYEN